MGRAGKGRVRASSLAGLGAELSEVINRVRRAFGPIPMADFAGRPEILQAEGRVSRAARQVARGQGQPEAWRRALAEYEACWMQFLAAGRANRAA